MPFVSLAQPMPSVSLDDESISPPLLDFFVVPAASFMKHFNITVAAQLATDIYANGFQETARKRLAAFISASFLEDTAVETSSVHGQSTVRLAMEPFRQIQEIWFQREVIAVD